MHVLVFYRLLNLKMHGETLKNKRHYLNIIYLEKPPVEEKKIYVPNFFIMNAQFCCCWTNRGEVQALAPVSHNNVV